MGEVGFEVLYWIPLLRRLLDDHGVPPEAVVAVSRGGCASWYSGLASRYVDALDMLTPEDFARRLAQRRLGAGDQKQVRFASFDRRLAVGARSYAQLPRTAISLHPSVMHGSLRAIWAGRRPAADIERLVRFATLPAPQPSPTARPSDPFVALKAYHSGVFPATARNRRWVLEFTVALSSRIRVMTLANRTPIDEHPEVPVQAGSVEQIDVGRDIRNNLAVQSDVFAHAVAAVSTYGGMAYVPMLHGVPTVGLRAAGGDNPVHLEVARLATARVSGVFEVVDIRLATPTETADRVAALSDGRVAARRLD